MSTYKPTIAFDFDGVLCYYDSWHGPEIINGGPVLGIKALLSCLADDYKLIIISSRAKSKEGREAILNWLKEYNLEYFDDVTCIKEPALVYIDDRAVRFTDSDQLVRKLSRLNDVYIDKKQYKKLAKIEHEEVLD